MTIAAMTFYAGTHREVFTIDGPHAEIARKNLTAGVEAGRLFAYYVNGATAVVKLRDTSGSVQDVWVLEEDLFSLAPDLSGHYVPGSDGNHMFHVHCPECTAHYLSTMSLGTVESYWEQGIVSRDELDGYRALWAMESPSGSNPHWRGLANEWTDRIRAVLA